jgi:GcrA cell cycle regulator
MVWTDERIEQLRELWAEGLTTGEIGKRLGVSKNAVVGKAHRLELKGRPSPIKRSKTPRAAPAAPKEKDQKIRSVVDLSAHTCRWPIGDPREPGFHFCGAPSMATKPYCEKHAAIAYVGSSSRSSARDHSHRNNNSTTTAAASPAEPEATSDGDSNSDNAA